LKLLISKVKESLSLIETIPVFIFGPPLKIKFLKNLEVDSLKIFLDV
jgi:hypothetical protein